jgi:hypothetical protein
LTEQKNLFDVLSFITFLLKSCRRSNTIVKCNFSIKNKGAAKTLQLSAGESSLIVVSGKAYKAIRVGTAHRPLLI